MELEVRERLLLLMLMPEHGNIGDIRLINELKSNLSFTEGEHKDWNLKRDEDGNYTWDKNNTGTYFDIGERAKEIIKAELTKLSDSGRATERHLKLYDKFGM